MIITTYSNYIYVIDVLFHLSMNNDNKTINKRLKYQRQLMIKNLHKNRFLVLEFYSVL